mmetsp:Transcript_11687/g.28461  ORF Transcript_11687/g.28461 Transcript_11687/m.28461 type:complete len:162 (-) Transcript_11687:131-616(-)
MTPPLTRPAPSVPPARSNRNAKRTAVASGSVILGPVAYELVAQNQLKKGDALSVAQLAGVMGAKHTSLLIPLCHPLALTNVHLDLELDGPAHAVKIRATASTVGPTGVEMEALTAVSVAALTIYDMTKAAAKDIVIGPSLLESKTGGQGGDYHRRDGEDLR